MLNAEGEVVAEKQLKSATVYTANGVDLIMVARKLEETINAGVSDTETPEGE